MKERNVQWNFLPCSRIDRDDIKYSRQVYPNHSFIVIANKSQSSVMPDGQAPKDYQKLQTSAASMLVVPKLVQCLEAGAIDPVSKMLFISSIQIDAMETLSEISSCSPVRTGSLPRRICDNQQDLAKRCWISCSDALAENVFSGDQEDRLCAAAGSPGDNFERFEFGDATLLGIISRFFQKSDSKKVAYQKIVEASISNLCSPALALASSQSSFFTLDFSL
eukprot:581338-Hanusia_phi.AAC.10